MTEADEQRTEKANASEEVIGSLLVSKQNISETISLQSRNSGLILFTSSSSFTGQQLYDRQASENEPSMVQKRCGLFNNQFINGFAGDIINQGGPKPDKNCPVPEAGSESASRHIGNSHRSALSQRDNRQRTNSSRLGRCEGGSRGLSGKHRRDYQDDDSLNYNVLNSQVRNAKSAFYRLSLLPTVCLYV